MWNILHKTRNNCVSFDELVQCLESVGKWIQSQGSRSSVKVRYTVTRMFQQLNKDPGVDELSEDEFIHW